MTRVLGFVAAALATLEGAPGAGDVAALDALGLVQPAQVGLGHVETGPRGRLLRRPIAVGDRRRGGRGRSGGVACRLAAGGGRRRSHRALERAAGNPGWAVEGGVSGKASPAAVGGEEEAGRGELGPGSNWVRVAARAWTD